MSGEFAKCMNWRCDWHGPSDDLLRAADPFNDGDEVVACPKCRDQNVAAGCDEPVCTKQGSCGWPSPGGYRRTCGTHWRKEPANERG